MGFVCMTVVNMKIGIWAGSLRKQTNPNLEKMYDRLEAGTE